ncbi:MAG: hypothetical protein KF896_14265 [Ignavibacteriae bacterium]|nr:hypothetical protein [Ignavibacteriota bacterium]
MIDVMSVDKILDKLMKNNNIDSIEKLHLDDRRRQTSDIRHLTCYFLKHNVGLSESQISKLMKRDRSTIYSSIKRAEELIEYDKDFNRLFNKMKVIL